jgi:hypothetical protein
MKVVACIFAIFSGIFGLFGATAQGLFGSGMSVFTHSNEMMNNGVTLFYLSWIVIILGGLSLKFPNSCGVGLLIISLIAFSLGNIFSAPFAFIAGIFGLFAETKKKNIHINGGIGHQIISNQPDDNNKENLPTGAELDKTLLLNQLSQLHDLKEKNVITDEIYEQERQIILSKFQKNEPAKSEVIQKIDDDQIIIEHPQYDPAYEELFAKKTFFKKNKFVISLLLLGIIIASAIWILYNNLNNNKENEKIEVENNIPQDEVNKINLVFENGKTIPLSEFPDDEGFKAWAKLTSRDSTATRYLLDLGNDKVPELITNYFSGGAHCCDENDIFSESSENTYKHIFHFTGNISINRSEITLYVYEDLGYFKTGYARTVDTPETISPKIALIYKSNRFNYSPTNEKLNREIAENLDSLRTRGIPDINSDGDDDRTRKAYACDIVTFYFNNNRDLNMTKNLFEQYYTNSDKQEIWHQLKRYMIETTSNIEKNIKFDQLN